MLKDNKNAVFEVTESKNLKDIKQNWMDIKQNGSMVRCGVYAGVEKMLRRAWIPR